MKSTNVPSNDNQQNKSEITMIATKIVDKQNENNFQLIAGENGKADIYDYIVQQLGPEIPVGNAILKEDGKLIANGKELTMKNGIEAIKNVKQNQNKRSQLQNKKQEIETYR